MSSWIKTAIERLMKMNRKFTTSKMKDVLPQCHSFCLDIIHLLLSQVLCITIAMAHVCHVLLNILVVISGEVIVINRHTKTDISWCILLALGSLQNGWKRSGLQCRGWKCCKSILEDGRFLSTVMRAFVEYISFKYQPWFLIKRLCSCRIAIEDVKRRRLDKVHDMIRYEIIIIQ